MAIHICTIGLTGTSVNPARSLGPAIAAAIGSNTEPIKQVIAFIVGPLFGAAIGGFAYKFLEADDKK